MLTTILPDFAFVYIFAITYGTLCITIFAECVLCIKILKLFFCAQRIFVCYNKSMKVIRNLEITAAEFFGAVFEELTAQIGAADKTVPAPTAFQTGFTYVYNPEDPALKITFEIVEYQEDKFYKAVRTSSTGTITMIYEVVPNDKGITVSFSYDNDAETRSGKRSRLFAAFSEMLFLGRMTDRLYGLQRNVINKKEGFTEKKSNSPFLPDIRKSK